ncbi:hypothetical protein ASD36_03965 [Rhizobium sp. Root1334]|nr:hypothetical protein ASD36_03965 [Rhizobium sp. Root1334]
MLRRQRLTTYMHGPCQFRERAPFHSVFLLLRQKGICGTHQNHKAVGCIEGAGMIELFAPVFLISACLSLLV